MSIEAKVSCAPPRQEHDGLADRLSGHDHPGHDHSGRYLLGRYRAPRFFGSGLRLPQPAVCLARWSAVAVVFLFGALGATAETCAKSGDERPNIILINLDDATASDLSDESLRAYFPGMSQLRAEGLRFTNTHVTTPLCGPSRACLMRGQYASNLGMLVHYPSRDLSRGLPGSFVQYALSGFHLDDLPVRMSQGGYRTMHVGKYLHPYLDENATLGWDDHIIGHSKLYHASRRYVKKLGESPYLEILGEDDYRTVVEGENILELIRDAERVSASEGRQPFFLSWSPIAPHDGGNDDPIADMIHHPVDGDRWQDLELPPADDVMEANMSDKHPALRALNETPVAHTDSWYRARILSLLAFDRVLRDIMIELQDNGEIENTYVILTSDNGFQLGHHRLYGKMAPFERNTNVPLICWGPGIASNRSADHLIKHIDLMPTILDLAGEPIPGYVDGRSIAPLLFAADDFSPETWQPSILIQNWAHQSPGGNRLPFTYSELRMYDSVYTEWSDGFREFYDLTADPFQLVNRYSSLSNSTANQLHQELMELNRGSHHPVISIVSPDDDQMVGPKTLSLAGIASADSELRSVYLQIRNMENLRYWNGSGWQNKGTSVRADLVQRGLQSEWSYQPGNLGIKNTTVPLEITARALDEDADPGPNRSILEVVVDAVPPLTRIGVPAPDETFDGPPRIRGLVVDQQLGAQVMLVIRNRSNGRYWTGEKFQSEYANVRLSTNEEGRWAYTFPKDRGTYLLSVRAVDAAGNVEPPTPALTFRIRASNP